MRKTWLILAFTLNVSLLCSSEIFPIQAQTSGSSAYYGAEGTSITWAINEPKNQTYNTATITLNYTVETFCSSLTKAAYSIDGQPPITLPRIEQKTDDDPITQRRTGEALLSNLTDGGHKLTVYIDGLCGKPSEPIKTQKTVVFFEINTSTENSTPNKPDDKTSSETNAPTYGEDITVWSPTNRTYKIGEAIKLEATSKNLDYHLHGAAYNLDGTIYTLYNKENQSQARDPSFGTLFGCVTLPKLAEGQHKLTVHLQIVYAPKVGDFVEEVTVYFSVGNKNTPNITLQSLDGVVFNQSSVPLNFTIDKPVSWIAYCLDNGTQETITGNTTITASPGNHTLVVYANDTSGNVGQSSVAQFVVEAPSSSLTGNVAMVAAIVSASIVAVVVALFVVSRYRKVQEHSV